MGVELELGVVLVIIVLGVSIFDRFEVETAAWRKALRFLLLTGATVGLYALVGHWSLILPVAAAALGTTVHFVWCRRNGIHPIRATPRRRYYQLRSWEWVE